MHWLIVIRCGGRQMGDPIPCTGWNVVSRLAAVHDVLPLGWHAEAYPRIPQPRHVDEQKEPVS